MTVDRELAAFIRFNGLLDSWRSDLAKFPRTDSLPNARRGSDIDLAYKMARIPPANKPLVYRPTSTASLRRTTRLRRPCVHSLSVQRFAVQRRGRRASGSLMLLQFLCGDCVRCNGRLDGGQHTEATRPLDSRRPICANQCTVSESLPTTGLAISSGDRPSNDVPFSGEPAARTVR